MFLLIDELNRVFENELVDKINKYSSLGYSVEVKPLRRGPISRSIVLQTVYKVNVYKWVEN
ncbi:hypothetical protein [Enterococcus casseliflavus]|uniref:hypothetical protein n=1 Tax=Enterococcus casseliflavus TaxID=37734 RepID=UPI001E630890|nr:hypothetical protein [Enterococcus casseliflavus]